MRLDPAEVPELPFAAVLLDAAGQPVAATPEWRGVAPGGVSFSTGAGFLVVAPAEDTAPELEALMEALLGAIRDALPALDGRTRLGAAVLLAGLELVSGRPLAAGDRGTTTDVLAHAEAALAARTPSLRVQMRPEAEPRTVPAPATIALALVQLAANAAAHEFTDAAGTRRVDLVTLRVAPGPSFYVEWRSEGPAGVVVSTARHQAGRQRWGWGYVRMAADALGGGAVPPGPTGEGLEGACFTIGSQMLTIPLACFESGALARSTQTWEQETAHAEPRAREALAADLDELLQDAVLAPGVIVRRGLLAARRSGRRAWAALPPEAGAHRVRDVLRGLEHERALWAAPEPHATRVHALALAMARAVGDTWPTFDAGSWARGFPAACAALSLRAPRVEGAALYPEPRVAAYLLSELGGRLAVEDEVVVYRPPPTAATAPILTVLDPAGPGAFALTPPLDAMFR
jgi:hypothetical protein